VKIFIKRIGFTLIRVHRQQSIATSAPDAELLLQNLKWPIETLFVGLRPTSQKNDLANWHKFTSVGEDTVSVPNLITNETTIAAVLPAINATGAVTGISGATGNLVLPQQTVTVSPTFAAASAKIATSAKTLDRVTISAHGIFLYNDLPADFFHQYTCYTYGGPHINTPEDEGALMIPFNLYPGTYQPSGHVNVSRAREFYFKYSSSVIGVLSGGSAVAGELSILASAINFLLISDGKPQQIAIQSAILYIGASIFLILII
jgi:hypothetical protein